MQSGIKNKSIRMQMTYFDANGQPINFVPGTAYAEIESLNNFASDGSEPETATVNSGGSAITIAGSSVKAKQSMLIPNFNSGLPWPSVLKGALTWNYLPGTVMDQLKQALDQYNQTGDASGCEAWIQQYYDQYNWDKTTSPYNYFGAGLIQFSGSVFDVTYAATNNPEYGCWEISTTNTKQSHLTKPQAPIAPIPPVAPVPPVKPTPTVVPPQVPATPVQPHEPAMPGNPPQPVQPNGPARPMQPATPSQPQPLTGTPKGRTQPPVQQTSQPTPVVLKGAPEQSRPRSAVLPATGTKATNWLQRLGMLLLSGVLLLLVTVSRTRRPK
ncbi:hypothetical protein M8332_00625 [Fructilactobacillus ixorae]|uniref:Gram-positive cocci surface proteins LPxTG domain-containing protein n=1 Tax=Fructilactobacillus ixorae TaxID=1750535 RepID=A0ABY5C4V4_9LACO|nr:hypothetical protein M8332_00625 [Fructilactobacillus ixorae]